jgi:hypothetical protein
MFAPTSSSRMPSPSRFQPCRKEFYRDHVGAWGEIATHPRARCLECRARQGPGAKYLCSGCLASGRGRRWGAEIVYGTPKFSVFRVDGPLGLIEIARGDLASITTYWQARCHEIEEDPGTLIKGRGERYERSSLIVAELVEAGAYQTDIAKALRVSRSSIADRLARARQILRRDVTRSQGGKTGANSDTFALLEGKEATRTTVLILPTVSKEAVSEGDDAHDAAA